MTFYNVSDRMYYMKPKRIILVRHGQSEGNFDKKIYSVKPDYALYLTKLGIEQAKDVGIKLNTLMGNESFGIYHSPFFRSRQTMDCALTNMDVKPLFIKEEPRLREQEWSAGLRTEENFEGIQEERDNFGHFYYRFNGGESCADVYDRVSDFLDTLFRDFDKFEFPDNCLIFGHGMTNRVFLMRFLHNTVEEFEKWSNPKNCEYFILQLQTYGKYKLTTVLREHELKHKYQYNFKG